LTKRYLSFFQVLQKGIMHHLRRILIALVVMAGTIYSVSAQRPTDPGVRIKENRPHSVVYEVKIKGMFAPQHASRIDDFFKTKEGVIKVSTVYETGVTTVEVKPGYTNELLIDIVHGAGFEVAKSFEE
jgi:hypothetical protein